METVKAGHAPPWSVVDVGGQEIVAILGTGDGWGYKLTDGRTQYFDRYTWTLKRLATPEERLMGMGHAAHTGRSGSDPEVFALDASGEVLPAWGYAPPKSKPHTATSGLVMNTKVFWDGAQAEFTFSSQSCHAYLVDCVQFGLKNVLQLARAKDPKAYLSATPTVLLSADALNSATPAHLAFGCMPSANAYGLESLQPTPGLRHRFAGCHMHFSHTEEVDRKAFVRWMDRLAGVVSVAILAELDCPLRRKYYGRAGEYRTPTYGTEYRTLSSAIMWHPALVHLLFDLARVGRTLARVDCNMLPFGSDEEVIAIINECDTKAARKFLTTHKAFYEKVVHTLYRIVTKDDSAAALRAFAKLTTEGLQQHMDLNMSKYWHLEDGGWAGHSATTGSCFSSFATTLR